MPVSRRRAPAGVARARRRTTTPLGPDEVRRLFERLRAAMPAPRSELVYRSAYQLLVAVILSAQATDRSVNLATKPLFKVAGTPGAMVALGERRLARYIRTIGLWRNKAKNVIALSEALIRDYGGEVPGDRDELTKLPGVGRKTANVVLNMAFGQPTMAVDTHIFRIGNRLGLAPGKTPEEVEAGLIRIIPPEYMRHAHHWLILHGRYVCKARKPECERCVIADICKAAEKTNSIPAPLAELKADAFPGPA